MYECCSAFGDVCADVGLYTEFVNAEVELYHGVLAGGQECAVIRKPNVGHLVSRSDGVAEVIVF